MEKKHFIFKGSCENMETTDSSAFQLQVWALSEFLISLEFNLWKAS